MDTNLGQVALVKDINPGVSDFNPRYRPQPIDLNPNKLYSPPPSQVPDGSFPGSLVEFKDQLYFAADDEENGRELFVSDGTAEGTQLVKDIRPGENSYGYSYGSSPYNLTEFDNKLYFTANDAENGNELFVSDGTSSGTQLLVDLRPGESSYGYSYGSNASNLTEFDDKLYFTANNGENGNELFVTDGTGSGTQLVIDLRPGENNYGSTNGSYPSNLTEFNDKLYFTANNGENGNELYVSDGTGSGTQLVKDLFPGSNKYGSYSSYPSNLTEFDDKLYFTANNGENGNELYVSDGTDSGTQLLADLFPGDNKYGNVNSSDASNLTEFNDKLYFTANDGVHGNELFVSDGTLEGIELVADIRPGAITDSYINGSYPSNLVEFDDKLYFMANDGEHGNELFVTDGTTEGTKLVADINPGLNNYSYPDSSFPSNLTVVGDELFFSANNGQTGDELFKLTIDDSTEGTTVLINGSDGSDNLLGSDRPDQIQTLGGNDTVEGGNGDDIFVLRSGDGSDTILDFNLGSDRFGLADGLQFDELSFSGNNILAEGEVLASLEGINTEQLSSTDFSAV
jgi:ELWxxDGT repeat protein